MILSSLSIPFAEQNMQVLKLVDTFICYPISMMSQKFLARKIADSTKDVCSHRTKKNTLDNCWSNFWIGQHDFFDAFVIHGSAI